MNTAWRWLSAGLALGLGAAFYLFAGDEVHELGRSDHPRALIVIYSGDGGWRTVDQKLAKQMGIDDRKRGDIAVLGVDSLKYFSRARTPDEVAGALTGLIRGYQQDRSVNHIVLLGYSFGADIVPFVYNRLPDELRQRVVMLSLVAPSGTADFHVTMHGLLPGGHGPSLPIAPELARIDPAMVQCIYGQAESEKTPCRSDVFSHSEVIALRGGHHFGHHYEPLARRIRRGLERRSAVEASS